MHACEGIEECRVEDLLAQHGHGNCIIRIYEPSLAKHLELVTASTVTGGSGHLLRCTLPVPSTSDVISNLGTES